MNAVISQTIDLAERQRYIGGADAAAAVELNPYQSRFDLWQEKLGLVAPFEGNERTLWGKLHEPLIRQQYAERTGRIVRLPTETLYHPEVPYIGCHPDGLIAEERRLFEAKTARYETGFGEEGTDQVPEHYLIQCQHNMGVVDAEVADLAVLLGGSELRIYTIVANKALQEHLFQAEVAFWNYVLKREPPPVDPARKDACEVLKRLYPGTDGSAIDATDDDAALRAQYVQLGQDEKSAKESREHVKATLLARMGNATFLRFKDGKSLRRAKVNRTAYSVDASEYIDFRLVKS